MGIVLEKYHGLGNDYLVLDPRRHSMEPSEARIRLLCDRNFGFGSDGLLYGPTAASGGRIGMRIYNPDGSEAEKSGNGVRIFARYLRDFGYVEDDAFTLSTLGGDVHVSCLGGDGRLIRAMMGGVTFRSGLIPVAGADREVVGERMGFGGAEYEVTCLSIGNPHCVIPMDEISREKALEIGRVAESAPCFPNRINVQLMKVMDRGSIAIEIYERGAGYTLASGSSSCAAASAARRLGLVDGDVTVHMPGGALEVEMRGDGSVYMTGPVARVGELRCSDELMEALAGL
ncbi:MAG: diaminopimelate epimerase [Clostridiales Family XIII bacterium]|jgi:diaminopimelate epimerase|nr:diaminopimelate epimerase [Clostridiales Family XIII bacterium]